MSRRLEKALLLWFGTLLLLVYGCSLRKPAEKIPPGMVEVAKYRCVVEANDAKTQKPKIMTCDDGKGNKQVWRAE